MALVGNMIATAFAGNPSIVNYDMFVAVFGMLSLFYLIPATFNEGFQFHPALMVGLDVLNTLFFLIGGIATAAYLGVHSCGNAVRRATTTVSSCNANICLVVYHDQQGYQRIAKHLQAMP